MGIKDFAVSKYTLDRAIINAAKAAYLSKLIEFGKTEVHHFELIKISDT